jgi:hypothetical protein
MSLLFADSFDHYAPVSTPFGLQHQLAGKWDNASTAPRRIGRRGTNGIYPGDVNNGLVKNLNGQYATLIVGTAMFADREGVSSLQRFDPFGLEPSAGGMGFVLRHDGWDYVRLGITTDGRFVVSRSRFAQAAGGEEYNYITFGGRTQLLVTEPNLFQFGQWNYVEFKATASYTTGSFYIYVNGVEVAAVEDVRTVPFIYGDDPDDPAFLAPATFTQVALVFNSTSNNGSAAAFDDFYIFDDTGSTNNDVIGDVQVDLILPDGVGAASDSTIEGSAPAASRWESARVADGATAFVRLAAVDEEDSYTFEDLPYETADVFGVQVVTVARKSDSGPARLALTNRVGSGEIDAAPDLLPPSAGDIFGTQHAALDASAEGAWTLERVQDSEFGVRRQIVP